MRWAGREVCGGFEIGVDIDQKLNTVPASRTSVRSPGTCGLR